MTTRIIFKSIFTLMFMFSMPIMMSSPTHAQQTQMNAAPQQNIELDAEFLNLFQVPKSTEHSGYDTPHRTAEELASWLAGVIMNALDISAAQARQDVEKSRAHFSKFAFREYLTFLSEQSYWLFITKRKYNMNAASTRLPALLCKKEQAGLYTWIYEVPVIINLLETEATKDIKGQNAQEVVNLRIRLVRIPNMPETPENPHQVLIENWSLQDDSAILNNSIEGCM